MSGPEPNPGRGGAPARQRLFFALWPDARAAAALAATATHLAAACGGRAMRRETLHLTLAFLGDVVAERLPEVLAAGAEAVATGPAGFEFALDHVGWWRHNRIVWAGCRERPLPLAGLAASLAAALDARGLPGATAGFTPHVTLLRTTVTPPAQVALSALRWPVAELVLVASTLSARGAAYRRVAAWPLAAEGGR